MTGAATTAESRSSIQRPLFHEPDGRCCCWARALWIADADGRGVCMDKMLPLFVCGIADSMSTRCDRSSVRHQRHGCRSDPVFGLVRLLAASFCFLLLPAASCLFR